MDDGQVFARMRDCACPGTPHDKGDGVWLRPTVSLAGGIALENDLNEAVAELRAAGRLSLGSLQSEITARWLVTAIRHNAVGWNLVAETGPVPFDVQVLLDDYNLARHVADVASDLYTNSVLVPLAERLSGHSRNGSTGGSTSPKARSTRKPSKRSSPVTSAATPQ